MPQPSIELLGPRVEWDPRDAPPPAAQRPEQEQGPVLGPPPSGLHRIWSIASRGSSHLLSGAVGVAGKQQRRHLGVSVPCSIMQRREFAARVGGVDVSPASEGEALQHRPIGQQFLRGVQTVAPFVAVFDPDSASIFAIALSECKRIRNLHPFCLAIGARRGSDGHVAPISSPEPRMQHHSPWSLDPTRILTHRELAALLANVEASRSLPPVRESRLALLMGTRSVCQVRSILFW